MNPHQHLKAAQALVDFLENHFKVLKARFGIDPLLGLIPGLGDLVTFIIALYIIWIAKQLNVSQDIRGQMLRNLVLDLFLGVIPFLGDISDFFYKANVKNLELLKKHASITTSS